MSRSEKKSPERKSPEKKSPENKSPGRKSPENKSPEKKSPEKRAKPLPPRPDLNDQDEPESSNVSRNGGEQVNSVDESNVQSVDSHYQSVDDEKSPLVNGTEDTSHYQSVEENKLYSEHHPPGIATNGSHYQAIDDQKLDTEYAEPRARLNTHSSNPDLTKIPTPSKGKLDPSKRTTIHRSAPSLALYSTVNKKSKGSPKLTKSGSTFRLFKRIGRSSKKEEETYDKISRKSKKSQKKLDDRVVSTSSLKPLVPEDETASYVDIDGEESALARSLMDRRDSKRPLPDLPQQPSAET